jgi:hypothetical protein
VKWDNVARGPLVNQGLLPVRLVFGSLPDNLVRCVEIVNRLSPTQDVDFVELAVVIAILEAVEGGLIALAAISVAAAVGKVAFHEEALG